jgi:hypothetical protein
MGGHEYSDSAGAAGSSQHLLAIETVIFALVRLGEQSSAG